MRLRLEVTGYEERGDYHYCRDESGAVRRVDLMVSGELSAYRDDRTGLIGKHVSVAGLYPYIELAIDVQVTTYSDVCLRCGDSGEVETGKLDPETGRERLGPCPACGGE